MSGSKSAAVDRAAPLPEGATACGRCAARAPTDGWAAGWTGTSELGCWLMDPLFRPERSTSASEADEIAWTARSGRVLPVFRPLRGDGTAGCILRGSQGRLNAWLRRHDVREAVGGRVWGPVRGRSPGRVWK